MTDCIFCKFANGEIKTDIVFESDNVLAFRDINPKAETHILIIPKKHIANIADATFSDLTILGEIQLAAREIAKDLGLEEKGYRLVANTGENAGQEVFHLHYHLLGGNKLGMYW